MTPGRVCRASRFLEVDANAGEESASVRVVEGVVADVGQSGIVAPLNIEHVEHDAATEAQATVEPAEIVIVERTLGHAVAEILDAPAHAPGKVASQERRDGDVVGYFELILQHERHFYIIERVGELSAIVVAFAAFLVEPYFSAFFIYPREA